MSLQIRRNSCLRHATGIFCSAFSIGFCEFWCLFDWFRNAPFKWCSLFNFCFNAWLLHPLGLDGFPNATTLLSRFFWRNNYYNSNFLSKKPFSLLNIVSDIIIGLDVGGFSSPRPYTCRLLRRLSYTPVFATLILHSLNNAKSFTLLWPFYTISC